MDGFTCSLVADGDRSRIVLTGEIDIAIAIRFDAVATDALERELPIVVDLSAVSFIDGSGLASLMALAERAATAECSVTFQHRPPVVSRILDLTHEALASA
jgi:anti-sigma B factor antagonist